MSCNKEVVIFTSDEAKPETESSLGGRLRAIREEIYGKDGIETISEVLGVSPRSWRNYEEIGEVMPAQTLLRLIELTGVDPLWLMRGEGTMYRLGRPGWNPGLVQDPKSAAGSTSRRSAGLGGGFALNEWIQRFACSGPV